MVRYGCDMIRKIRKLANGHVCVCKRKSQNTASHPSPRMDAKAHSLSKKGTTATSGETTGVCWHTIASSENGRLEWEQKIEKRKEDDRDEDVPHALQILLPALSRRQRGVVLVPQLVQLRAPTGTAAPLLARFWGVMLRGGGGGAGLDLPFRPLV